MGKNRRINVRSRNYRGDVGRWESTGRSPFSLPQGSVSDEFGLFDLRPLRFADGARATEILTELVNLPDDPDSPQVEAFIARKCDLALGGTDSGGVQSRRMPAEEVIRLRGLYRMFWGSLDQLKASIFMQLLGPDPRAFQSPISEMHGKTRQAYLDAKKSIYPHGDYRSGALRINWKTGALTIVARGPIDKLTHAVYQHRNRLRECPKCKRLFIAFSSNEFFCPFGCKLERVRERKRKDATKRRTALRVDGLTSRGKKPKRKIARKLLDLSRK
jgi:hypothetical protein